MDGLGRLQAGGLRVVSRRMSGLGGCPKPELPRPEAPGGTATRKNTERLLQPGLEGQGLWPFIREGNHSYNPARQLPNCYFFGERSVREGIRSGPQSRT